MSDAHGRVTILDGNTFVVSDGAGDVEESSRNDPTGLFAYDTRFLSRWILTIDGQRLNPLSVDDVQYYEARFFLVPGEATVYLDATLSVIRQRTMGHGFDEQLTILNHGEGTVDLEIRVDAGSDFADLFEIKDARPKKGRRYQRVEEDRLVLGYERETFHRTTVVTVTCPAAFDDRVWP
jgi:hypothetical protein